MHHNIKRSLVHPCTWLRSQTSHPTAYLHLEGPVFLGAQLVHAVHEHAHVRVHALRKGHSLCAHIGGIFIRA
eukprot:1156990-Pelagomonas_calceolata.AAC.3